MRYGVWCIRVSNNWSNLVAILASFPLLQTAAASLRAPLMETLRGKQDFRDPLWFCSD